MRIVSGKARGRTLLTPPSGDLSIRPTADRVREALFNILGKAPVNARVLDLFAGTGALGLEAFSRGAHSAAFVDSDNNARQLIHRNIVRLFAEESTHKGRLVVLSHDLGKGMPYAALLKLAPTGFDLIFADPPYGQGLSLTILDCIDKSSLLSESGVLIIEERSTIALPQELMHLRKFDQRRYGEAGLWFFRHHIDSTDR